MNKHAYLIMAHNNWKILKLLLCLLDYENHDIFLHIDKKSKDEIPESLFKVVKKSKLIVIDSIDIYWADYSIVECELRLLETARKTGQYSYFHLLSGVDLPIKSAREIYSFFEKSGQNFIGIVPNEVYYSVRRVKFYHPFTHMRSYRNCKLLKGLDRLLEYAQKFISINRLRNINWKIIDGWQWFSITNELCDYLLDNKEKIESVFKYTISCDELVLQTLIHNSKYYNTLYDVSDLKNGSMRYIDWERGKPYTWGCEENDFDKLMNSPYMFARKFDETHMEIVEKIYKEISRRNNDEQ